MTMTPLEKAVCYVSVSVLILVMAVLLVRSAQEPIVEDPLLVVDRDDKSNDEKSSAQTEIDCIERDQLKLIINDIMQLKGIEERFVDIFAKLEDDVCDKCTDDENRLIWQLKLFKAIKQNRMEDAQAYLDILFNRDRLSNKNDNDKSGQLKKDSVNGELILP